jgi:CSLREA domain-containing protein
MNKSSLRLNIAVVFLTIWSLTGSAADFAEERRVSFAPMNRVSKDGSFFTNGQKADRFHIVTNPNLNNIVFNVPSFSDHKPTIELDWYQGPSITTENLNGVFFLNTFQGWIVGDTGSIWSTRNGGYHWLSQDSGVTVNLRDVYFLDASTGWAVGDSGTILHTDDGGITWSSQNSGIIQNLVSLHFVSKSQGWVTGFSSTILHTENGGISWEKQDPPTSYSFSQGNFIEFWDQDLSWIAPWGGNPGGGVLSTTDGGISWQQQQTNGIYYMTGLSFVSSSEGWAIGYGFDNSTCPGTLGFISWVYHTINGGDTWDVIASLCGFSGKVDFLDANNGWILITEETGTGHIYASTDGGTSWEDKHSGERVKDLQISGFLDGWAVGFDGLILKLNGNDPLLVTKTNDTYDAVCDDDCSLREAIVASNERAGSDIVIVPSGIYTLSISGTNESDSLTGDLNINDDLALVGSGTSDTIVDANEIDTVFEIAAETVFSGITIRNGNSGIFNNGGILTLNDSVVRDNSSFGGISGGGILNRSGTLTLNNSSVSNNSAGEGAGIYNDGNGTVILSYSKVMNNVAGNSGGGIRNLAGTVNLNNSVVFGNSSLSPGRGAGIHCENGTVTLTNSTVSGNIGSTGGGIYHTGNDSIVILNNSTVSNNSADVGGGIYTGGGVGSATILRNSILAGNVASTMPDCRAPANTPTGSAGYNLIGNNSGCFFTSGPGDQVGTDVNPIDPNLGPLQNNGGPTETHILIFFSRAINRGNPAGCTDHLGNPLLSDQRGLARVQVCDIGSYEFQEEITQVFMPCVMKN